MTDIEKRVPDLFTFLSGKKVQTKQEWEGRRQELKTWFIENVFGSYPLKVEEGFSFSVLSERTEGNIKIRRVELKKGSYRSQFWLYLPLGQKRPPAIIYPVLRTYESKFDLEHPEVYDTTPSVTTLPLGKILEEGFAVAAYFVTSAAPDEAGGELKGLNAELIKERGPSSAGAIAAWSFYAKRIMDYLIMDGTVDPNRIGMAGHSRGGKTALLTAATDERFRFAYVSNSGCTGAALARGNTGETIEAINTAFPHWFCENYKRYNGREEALPVDFHALCALVAPRLLYVTSSSEDAWACPPNEFASCRLASDVYTRIYGIKGLVAPDAPAPDEAYHEGNVAYHIKTGKHSFDYSDWLKLMAFLNKKL